MSAESITVALSVGEQHADKTNQPINSMLFSDRQDKGIASRLACTNNRLPLLLFPRTGTHIANFMGGEIPEESSK